MSLLLVVVPYTYPYVLNLSQGKDLKEERRKVRKSKEAMGKLVFDY
jgi:hypothetical protein